MELTQADFDILLREDKKLEPGQELIGRIKTAIIESRPGEPKVIKDFIANSQGESRMINFPGTPLIAPGITGTAATDTIKKNQKNSNKKHPFNFKKSLTRLLEAIEIDSVMASVNRGSVIYEYDDLGRVYFTDQFGNKYFVSPNLLSCVTEDRTKFYELIPTRDAFRMLERTDFDLAYFDYLYVSQRYRDIARKANPRYDFPINKEPTEEPHR